MALKVFFPYKIINFPLSSIILFQNIVSAEKNLQKKREFVFHSKVQVFWTLCYVK